MNIASLALLLAQYLPTIAEDGVAVAQVLGTASTAVNNAQAGDGTISAADWADLDAKVAGDLTLLAHDAGVDTPPA